jgi:hypothetical protein
MLTNSLPTNATSSFETRAPRPPRAIFPLLFERRAERRHVEGADRYQVRPPHHRVAANMVHPIVEISPPDSVERRTASWPGMAAEIVQATGSDRIESCFCAPVHLLAVYERGMRHEGETFVEGLPGSTLRDFRRKHVQAPTKMMPVGQPPLLDNLEFRLVRATINGKEIDVVVCEGVFVAIFPISDA